MHQTRKPVRGFSLIELLLAVSIMVIVATAFYSIFHAAISVRTRHRERIEELQQFRSMMHLLRKDVQRHGLEPTLLEVRPGKFLVLAFVPAGGRQASRFSMITYERDQEEGDGSFVREVMEISKDRVHQFMRASATVDSLGFEALASGLDLHPDNKLQDFVGRLKSDVSVAPAQVTHFTALHDLKFIPIIRKATGEYVVGEYGANQQFVAVQIQRSTRKIKGEPFNSASAELEKTPSLRVSERGPTQRDRKAASQRMSPWTLWLPGDHVSAGDAGAWDETADEGI